MQVDRLSGDLLEALENADRFDRQRDVGVVRELVADPARVPARRTRAEPGLAFEERDVGDAEAGQMKGHARAHASAADDDDVSGRLHGALPDDADRAGLANLRVPGHERKAQIPRN